MKIFDIIDNDITNYKEISMFIVTSKCSMKCGYENCQNRGLLNQTPITISAAKVIERYLNNKLSTSIVLGGLEPFDTFDDIIELISELRLHCADTVVIYTGYEEDEIKHKIEILQQFKNIIVKFGRYDINNIQKTYDNILGVILATSNQYAKIIS